MSIWPFRIRKHKQMSVHTKNIDNGQKLVVNGKTYIKVKLRFVDSLKFNTEKYIDGLETQTELLEKELTTVKELNSKSEIKLKQLQQLNVNLTKETTMLSHSSSKDNKLSIRLQGKVQKLEREIDRKANELIMLKSHSKYLQKRNTQILKFESVEPQLPKIDDKNKSLELFKKLGLNKSLTEKYLKSIIRKKDRKITKSEIVILKKEKEVINLKSIIIEKDNLLTLKTNENEILLEEKKDPELDKAIIVKQRDELKILEQIVLEREEQIKLFDKKIEKLQCLNRNLAKDKVEVKQIIIEDASLHKIKKNGEKIKAQYNKEIKEYKNILKELKKQIDLAKSVEDPWDKVANIWAEIEQ